MNDRIIIWCLLLCALTQLSTARPQHHLPSATRVDRLVVFGDSISDDGINTVDDFYGFQRWSNGPVWAGYAKDILGSKLENYAYGGAKSGMGNYYFDGWSGVLWQIEQFRNKNPYIPEGLLAVILSGTNDIFDGKNVSHLVLANWKKSLDSLITAGARQIIICNLPAVERMPFYETPDGKPIQATVARLTTELNKDLANLVGSNSLVRLFDLYDAMVDGLSTFAIVDRPFTHHRNDTQPTDIFDYAWYDIAHPATGLHSYIASRFYKFTQTINWEQ